MRGTRSLLLLMLSSTMMLIPGLSAAPQARVHQETDLSSVHRRGDKAPLKSDILNDLERDYHNAKDEVMLQSLANQLAKGVGNHSRSKRQSFLESLVNTNGTPEELIMFYARIGNFIQVKLLVTLHNASLVFAEDPENWTAMMWSSRFGHIEIVRYLLELDAVVNHQNDKGDTALLWATGAGHPRIVELLLQHDADPNLAENVHSLTPVSVAAAMNREEELRLMDKYASIDLDWLDASDRTPLNLAAMMGQATMALLLGYHGNVDVQDNAGMAPAHWGVNLRDTSVLQAVLLLCPNLTLEDNKGNTPLDIAKLVRNVAGIEMIEEHLSKPDRGCWIGDDELPAKEIIFFDGKQMQCMCGGHWRQTGVRDPEYIRPHVNVVAQQEVESSNHVTGAPSVTTEEDDDHHHHEEFDLRDLFPNMNFPG